MLSRDSPQGPSTSAKPGATIFATASPKLLIGDSRIETPFMTKSAETSSVGGSFTGATVTDARTGMSTTPWSSNVAEGSTVNPNWTRAPSWSRRSLCASLAGRKRRPNVALTLSTKSPSRISVAPSG